MSNSKVVEEKQSNFYQNILQCPVDSVFQFIQLQWNLIPKTVGITQNILWSRKEDTFSVSYTVFCVCSALLHLCMIVCPAHVNNERQTLDRRLYA